MSVSRKVAYNVIASSVSKILSTITALIGIGLITRYLGLNGFGMYATALAFLSFFGALGDWGIYQTATRKISIPKSNEDKVISNAIGIRLGISLTVILITPIIISFFPYSPQLKIAIFIIALSYVFSSSYQVLIGLFQKRLQMDKITFAEFVGKVVQVILIYIGIKLDLGFYFIVTTLLLNMIINFSIIAFLTRRFVSLKPSFDKKYWKNFLKQSLPIGFSVTVTFLYFKAGTILLSLFKPASEVGIYGAAHKVIENISFFPSMIVGLTMPMFAYNIFHNRKKFEFLANKNLKVFFILTIPLVIGGWFLAESIITIIVGPEFGQSAHVLRIIIFSLAFIFFGNLFNNILIAAKLQKYLLVALSICAIFNLVFNSIFIPKFSYLATSYISVLTEFLVVLITGSIIIFKLKYTPRISKVWRIIASGALMIAYLHFFQNKTFLFLFVTSPLIYFFGLIVLKAISKKEILSLVKKDA